MAKEFTTIKGIKFLSLLSLLMHEEPELIAYDVVFEDKNGIYHPIKKIVINRKLVLAMIALKESDELDVGDHEVKKEGE